MKRSILRLARCCGLRFSGIAQLRFGDVHAEGDRPHLVIRSEGAKGGRRRRVPLWWEQRTLDDLKAWKGKRVGHGAG
jgi:integrase